MKKIVTSILIIILALILCGNIITKRDTKNFDAKIYYVDHTMLRLIPVNVDIQNTTTKGAAKEVINKLVEGRDKNSKILRVLPNEEKCMSVTIKDNMAIVDLKENFIKNKPTNRLHGLLAIYQIVNSLTSINGIDTVKFYIDGKEDKGFVSGLDMRETFIPDYYL